VSRYPSGKTISIPIVFTDGTGAFADATSISLAVRKPDGTPTAGSPYTSPVHDSLGHYHQLLPAADTAPLGHYPYVVSGSVGGVPTVSDGDNFEVFDPFEVNVLPLQDAKDTLNIPQTVTVNDAEIRRKVATIVANMERTTGGPILNRTITDRIDISDSPWEIPVLKRPLVSVTSVTDVGTGLALDLTDIELDTNAGIIRRKLGVPFVTGSGVLTVIYVAGWGTAVPPGINEAAATILQFMWETQRGGASNVTSFGGQETVTLPGWGFPIPERAAWDLLPYARLGAVA